MSLDPVEAHRRAAALKALIAASGLAGRPRRALPPPLPEAERPLPRSRKPRRALPRFAERLERAGGELRALLDTGIELAAVNRAFAACLRQPLPLHARIARLDPAGWVVLVDSPVWASRLRFTLRAVHRQLEQKLRRPVPELVLKTRPASYWLEPERPRIERTPSSRRHGFRELDALRALLADASPSVPRFALAPTGPGRLRRALAEARTGPAAPLTAAPAHRSPLAGLRRSLACVAPPTAGASRAPSPAGGARALQQALERLVAHARQAGTSPRGR